MPTKRLRDWFTSLMGDTPINGFYQRFVGGGVSKPTESSFKDLFESVPFFNEADSASSVDSTNAIGLKQGLSIKASTASTLAGSDTPLGGTSGTLFCSPSQLPTVIPSVTNQTIRDFTNKSLTVVVDQTGTNNKYSADLNTTLVTTLNKYLLPDIGTGNAGKIPAINSGSTAYELITPSSGGAGYSWTGISSTSNTIGKGSKTFAVTPDAGTFSVVIGNRIRFTDSTDTTRYVEGIVSASSSSSITINADNSKGTGSLTSTKYNFGGDIPSADTSGVPNLFVSSIGGDDSTGDGSINKPFATLAFAQSLVIDNQTIIVFGGNYSNSINLVKAAINYTLYCFPGVTITQDTTSLYDSSAIVGRVNIIGEPNISCTALNFVTLPCFVVDQVAVIKLGKVTSTYKIADIYSKNFNLDGNSENTLFTVREASWKTVAAPAIKLMASTSGGPNGTILLNIGSLEYEPGSSATLANYIEIVDPYTTTISGNLQYRGSGTLTSPSFIKVTSTSFNEVGINRLTCRLGGAGVATGTIINLSTNDVSAKRFFVKDVQVSNSTATFVACSVASSIYAENIYMINGSTIQGGSATIRPMAPVVSNTRTFIGPDTNFGTLFNILS